ncbi:hypothetical protein [Umezawaea tangerina]|uniref:MOSC domain-containing protein n=1 Tax=Umezawaea tangerina TaxID=84725 RepID=A0A2T0SVH3_9PSEU|nr:hypothetical protein [Umezawaea tangerina]PRY37417.1 hypothetical protein CLV43_110228 [Umezawaea tangerina]
MSTLPPLGHLDLLLVAPSTAEFCTVPVGAAEFDVVANRIEGSVRNTGQVIGADVRSPAYPRYTPVLNRQSVSLISDTDLDHIAGELGLEAEACGKGLQSLAAAYEVAPRDVEGDAAVRLFLAQCLGVNVVVKGFQGAGEIEDFLVLPPGVDFGPYDAEQRKFTGATVMVTRVNTPCAQPAAMIAKYYPEVVEGVAKGFIVAGRGRRGFVGMVVRSGGMVEGDLVGFVPFGGR